VADSKWYDDVYREYRKLVMLKPFTYGHAAVTGMAATTSPHISWDTTSNCTRWDNYPTTTTGCLSASRARALVDQQMANFSTAPQIAYAAQMQHDPTEPPPEMVDVGVDLVFKRGADRAAHWFHNGEYVGSTPDGAFKAAEIITQQKIRAAIKSCGFFDKQFGPVKQPSLGEIGEGVAAAVRGSLGFTR
jgi:hypothetical protein